MLPFLKNLLGGLFGGGSDSIAARSIDVLAQKVEDVDKTTAAIVDLTKEQMRYDSEPVWLKGFTHWASITKPARAALVTMMFTDAAHKLARTCIVLAALWFANGQDGQGMNTAEMMSYGLGGAYILLKGKGK